LNNLRIVCEPGVNKFLFPRGPGARMIEHQSNARAALLQAFAPRSDNHIMARRVTGRGMACVLVLAACGWHGTFVGVSLGAEPALTANPVDRSLVDNHAAEDEELPDLNYLQAQAEVGRAKSQTRLADYFLAVSDLTNAVVWYRRATEQDDVPAQLSLAGCLMTGRGTAKNPAEAARLLRRAADLIESAATNRLPRVASTSSVPSALGTHRPASPPPAGHDRVERVNSLLAPEPALQEARPVLRPASDPRPLP
jgi:hypothetical protein